MKDRYRNQTYKTGLRPLYSEFQRYLSQARKPEKTSDAINDESAWDQYDKAVDFLSKETGNDYFLFKIAPIEGHGTYLFMRVTTYRQKIGGLISRLHGEYFYDEAAPFSRMPNTIINQQRRLG